MSLEQENSDGERAALLMQQMRPYFDKIREAIVSQWESSPIRDKEGQNELRLMRKLLNDLEANLQTVIDTGKLANIEIQREQSLMQKVRNIF